MESITEVKLDHELIQSHRVVKVIRVEETKSDEEDEAEVLPCDRPYEPPQIVELFLVSGQTVQFFKEAAGLSKGKGLTGAEVREVLKKYVAENELQNAREKSYVNLDPILASAVLAAKGENDVERLRWDELTSRLQARMSPGYSMQFPGEPHPRTHKGKLAPVELLVQSRGGRKTITCVRNLDPYRIDPGDLARRCQVGVSGSATVREAAASAAGALEVMVQGNHTVYLSQLLLGTYKIPRRYIKGFEEASRKGKGK